MMVVRTAEFELGAVHARQWPQDGLPEFAFVGRSNVGKSSLINALLGRRSLARVSATPGKTREINFYRVNGSFRFVDLPGYGYAAVSQAERARFQRMITEYLRQRGPLLRVLHLIDIRHDPTQDDVDVHQWLRGARAVCVVATKADKVSRSKRMVQVRRIQTVLRTDAPVLPSSATTREGLDDVWALLAADLNQAQGGSPSPARG